MDYRPDKATCATPDDMRCIAKTREGFRCRRPRKRGDRYCERGHKREVVEIEAVPRSAPPERVQAATVEVLRSAGLEVAEDAHLEPVVVMDWCVSQAHFITDAFMQRLRQSEDITEDEMSATVRAALEAIGHARKAAEAAESAGMQRRRAAVEEAKLRAVFLAADRAITRMGLGVEDDQRFRVLFSEELALVGGG